MTLAGRVAALPWGEIAGQLFDDGFAVVSPLLAPAECAALAAKFDDCGVAFRKTVDMARHNFGEGAYKYFEYPLPSAVQVLRTAFYGPLSVVANDWAERLKLETRWPDSLAAFAAQCHGEGQSRPTPLLLRYGAGGYNCLHQDLYGDVYFPLQVIVLLSAPGQDFDGGELVLVEHRPRMQSRPIVLPLKQGEAAIVPVRERPRQGALRIHRAQMRHGVAEVHRGTRTALGLIFHDAAG